MFPASALGAEGHVALDLGQQALYPDRAVFANF